MEWEAVIGLELHVQLSTRSKLFSGTSTAFGAEPNTQANIYDLAMPGTLPVLNGDALRMAVRFGLAIGAEISRHSIFDRKNYFYPDLPKGYQTSQLDFPIVGRGSIVINLEDGTEKRIGVTRAHMEEDAGKSLHEEFADETGIDLNRAGTPLLEIVSDPDLRSAREAVAYLKKMHSIVRYLDISDGDMSQGSMRCDANVSIRPRGEEELGTRTEIKNVNSFRFVEKAINYEIRRQQEVLEDGGNIVQETRLYDSVRDETRPMRSKEVANDYRYFPEPDLLPVEIDEDLIEQIRSELPELPDVLRERFQNECGVSAYHAAEVTAHREVATRFEKLVNEGIDPKVAIRILLGEYAAVHNRKGLSIEESPIPYGSLRDVCELVSDGTISANTAAPQIFNEIVENPNRVPLHIVDENDLRQISEAGEIEQLVDRVIAENSKQVQQFRDGKQQVLGYLVGQAMKLSAGKANPAQVNQLLRDKLQQ